jgi:hypothetical protein
MSDIKPYNPEDQDAQIALDAFFASDILRQFLADTLGVHNPRQNPEPMAVDVLADNGLHVELEIKRTAGRWHGFFPFPDTQVADRKIDRFERGSIFVQFDDACEWALVWDCSKLTRGWTRRHYSDQGGFLVLDLFDVALVKVDPSVPGPLVGYPMHAPPVLQPTGEEVSFEDF